MHKFGQYLLQRPHAALDISWPVHLSQTASATIGQPAEISIQRWTFCKEIALLVIGEKCCDRWGNGISIAFLVIGGKANVNGGQVSADRKGIVV